ncbi:Hypothetical predicted protein [Olea europaea subsp. europaea]|uniref:CLU central domain-containing protein n=1 Tax=Olea europaea subsp. europaea TaxID=158383 RepID=A0A8S0QNW4_OLEEU|nr:Hypothetical predicted protein [Olea europaea subsp. europaea]
MCRMQVQSWIAKMDTSTLGVVVIRHCGYTSIVKVAAEVNWEGNPIPQDIEIEDHPEGGANSLNVNNLRMLLQKSTSPQSSAPAQRLQSADVEELHTARPSVRKASAKTESKKNEEAKVEPPVKGLGKIGGLLKDFKKKPNDRSTKADPIKEVSPDELIEMVHKYYNDTALPKLVELADKLPHVQSLCVHEMVVRACKHILQAVVASVHNVANMAASIASCLNVLLGTPSTGHADSDITSDDELKWKWIETFLSKRFGRQWKDEIHCDLRKFAILCGLCQKVGYFISRSFDFSKRQGLLNPCIQNYHLVIGWARACAKGLDMDSPFPFKKSDIISLIPAYKHVACSLADGCTLLESSKTSLDKGKLEDSVNYGTKSAVVLYHTGDFNQKKYLVSHYI